MTAIITISKTNVEISKSELKIPETLKSNTRLLENITSIKQFTKYDTYRLFSLQDAYNVILISNNQDITDKTIVEKYCSTHLLTYSDGKLQTTEYAKMLMIEYLIAYGFIDIRLRASHVNLLSGGIEIKSIQPIKLYMDNIGINIVDIDDMTDFVFKLATNIYYSFYSPFHIENKTRLSRNQNLYHLLDRAKFWIAADTIKDTDLLSQLTSNGILDTMISHGHLFFRLSGLGQSYVTSNYRLLLYEKVHGRSKCKQAVTFVYD